ncbi:phage portal protein [Micromonospora sp. STR1s_5]|nr:phage portal protein [Micromonospora sp. STR1s_5]
MPLPAADAPWPPESWTRAKGLYDRWGAWYSGDPTELSRVYEGTTTTADPKFTTGAVSGGALVSQVPRMFWGSAPPQGSLRLAKLHIPLSADIASTSSDLLFHEPPAFRVPDVKRPDKDPTQQRMDTIMERGGWHSMLLEAGEVCSAYGGVYLRVGWDAGVADHVLFDAIPPDSALPEWRSGRLVAVTFWRDLPNQGDDKATWRHLERHEPGRITHGLFRSAGGGKLGEQRPLDQHPDTRPFTTLTDNAGVITTGAKGMTVEYVPNMRPNRSQRGSLLGRSDYDGQEPVLDALDESWSSWMRDLRIGKGKVMVPEAYLQTQGRGRGAVYDAEQEIYQTIAAIPSMQGLQMQVVQFAIRVAEHQSTCTALVREVVRGAGYSASTFGEDSEGAAVTATEVRAKQSRSFTTRGRKIEYWRPALMRLWETALTIDAKVFKSKAKPVLPTVEWPDGIAVDPEALARTIGLLEGAKAASTRTKVEMLHPDWDDKRIREEVKLIDSQGMPPAVPPPGAAADQPDDLDPDAEDPDAEEKDTAEGKPPAAGGKPSAGKPTTPPPPGRKVARRPPATARR